MTTIFDTPRNTGVFFVDFFWKIIKQNSSSVPLALIPNKINVKVPFSKVYDTVSQI